MENGGVSGERGITRPVGRRGRGLGAKTVGCVKGVLSTLFLRGLRIRRRDLAGRRGQEKCLLERRSTLAAEKDGVGTHSGQCYRDITERACPGWVWGPGQRLLTGTRQFTVVIGGRAEPVGSLSE